MLATCKFSLLTDRKKGKRESRGELARVRKGGVDDARGLGGTSRMLPSRVKLVEKRDAVETRRGRPFFLGEIQTSFPYVASLLVLLPPSREATPRILIGVTEIEPRFL